MSVEKNAEPNRKDKNLEGYHQIIIFNKIRNNANCEDTEEPG